MRIIWSFITNSHLTNTLKIWNTKSQFDLCFLGYFLGLGVSRQHWNRSSSIDTKKLAYQLWLTGIPGLTKHGYSCLLCSRELHISPVSGLQKHTGELEMFLRQHGQDTESPREIGVYSLENHCWLSSSLLEPRKDMSSGVRTVMEDYTWRVNQHLCGGPLDKALEELMWTRKKHNIFSYNTESRISMYLWFKYSACPTSMHLKK